MRAYATSRRSVSSERYSCARGALPGALERALVQREQIIPRAGAGVRRVAGIGEGEVSELGELVATDTDLGEAGRQADLRAELAQDGRAAPRAAVRPEEPRDAGEALVRDA